MAYCMQAFVDSGKAGGEYHPRPSPPVDLPIGEQLRVRDRSTIFARHIYADRGASYADAQVRLIPDSVPAVLACLAVYTMVTKQYFCLRHLF